MLRGRRWELDALHHKGKKRDHVADNVFEMEAGLAEVFGSEGFIEGGGAEKEGHQKDGAQKEQNGDAGEAKIKEKEPFALLSRGRFLWGLGAGRIEVFLFRFRVKVHYTYPGFYEYRGGE